MKMGLRILMKVIGLSVMIGLCPTAYPESASQETKDLREKARLLEQADEKGSAAMVYEQIVRKEPAQSDFLAPHIARLYAESGWTNQALAWAEKAAQNNPDPAAFRAGILTLLGDYTQAESILESELNQAETPHQKIILYWQLADVCERKGQIDKTVQYLQQAASSAQGSPDETAANRRLSQFQGSHHE